MGRRKSATPRTANLSLRSIEGNLAFTDTAS